MNGKPESIAVRKVRMRREAGLCGACGKDPCACKRPGRKQKFAAVKSPDFCPANGVLRKLLARLPIRLASTQRHSSSYNVVQFARTFRLVFLRWISFRASAWPYAK
jgi:hypothetical protein